MTLEQMGLLTDEIEEVLNKYGLQTSVVVGQFSDGPSLSFTVEPLTTPAEPKKLHSKCIRCGRTLRNSIAQERGYGEVCWKKHLTDNQSKLF